MAGAHARASATAAKGEGAGGLLLGPGGSTRVVLLLVENLTDQEFELGDTYVREGKPQLGLPSRFTRAARLSWQCSTEACAAAAIYESATSGPSSAPPCRLALGVVLANVGMANKFRSLVGKDVAGKVPGVLFRPPLLGITFTRGTAGRAPQLSKVLDGAAALDEGGRIDGCEWLVVRGDEDVVEVRVRLLPRGGAVEAVSRAPPTAMSAAASSGASLLQEAKKKALEWRDEAEIRRCEGFCCMMAALDAAAKELEALAAAEALDPRNLRELPDMARVDLVLALLMVLLRDRRRALTFHQLLQEQEIEENIQDHEAGGMRAVGRAAAALSSELFSSEDQEVVKERFRIILAKHVSSVYSSLVPLVIGESSPGTKLSRLAVGYLPGESGEEASVEPSDPDDFCKRLRAEVGAVAAAGAVAACAAGGPAHLDVGPQWSLSDATRFCEDGEESVFSGRVWVMERDVASTVPDCVERLNAGATLCPGDYCVCYSRGEQAYVLLQRVGKKEASAGSSQVDAVALMKGITERPTFAAGTPVPRLWLAARQLLALALGAGAGLYDARSRAAMFRLTSCLGVPPRLTARWEAELGGALFEAMEASHVVQHRKERRRLKSGLKVAGAALGGGILLAVTGGLAAPALAAGITSAGAAAASAGAAVGLTVPGAIVGSAIASGGVVLASLGTAGAAVLFGATGVGLTSYKMSKRWGSLAEFEFEPLLRDTRRLVVSVDLNDKKEAQHLQAALQAGSGKLLEDAVVPCAGGGEVALLKGSECASIEQLAGGAGPVTRFRFERQVDVVQRSVHLVLFVPGWVQQQEDFWEPWKDAARQFFPSSGQLCLKWESEKLLQLSTVFQDMLAQQAASQAASLWWKTAAGATAATSTLAALTLAWPVWVVSSMANLDNIWLVVAERARQAGKCLAHVLADKGVVGQRPVTLIGHSMGARLIFYCLEELYDLGEFNVVDDVVLLGAPIATSLGEWHKVRAVASGRVVNGFLGKDWVLAFLYRYMEWGISVAGISEVKVPGVENIDVAGLGVSGHHDYPNHIVNILAKARITERFGDVSTAPVQIG